MAAAVVVAVVAVVVAVAVVAAAERHRRQQDTFVGTVELQHWPESIAQEPPTVRKQGSP